MQHSSGISAVKCAFVSGGISYRVTSVRAGLPVESGVSHRLESLPVGSKVVPCWDYLIIGP